MGTKFAPTYANLLLGYLEEKLISECKIFLEKNMPYISKSTGIVTYIIVSFFG